jgi:tRNA1(Val) A37 N6-methylase TrmN6
MAASASMTFEIVTDPTELTCDAITRDYRIYQRKRGHRYSLDDLATAWQAVDEVPHAARVLDMGCGIGSVLLMLAWKLPGARLWGIEALDLSFALAQKNVNTNRLERRTSLIAGDLRQATAEWNDAPCDLVTGTPPYLPRGTAIASPDPQREAARIELRGGVEDYITAGARVLAEHGRLVVCADGKKPERVERAAAAANLYPSRRRDIWANPRAATPLFGVWTLRWGAAAPLHEHVMIRDEDGEQTAAARDMRTTFGL